MKDNKKSKNREKALLMTVQHFDMGYQMVSREKNELKFITCILSLWEYKTY